MCSHNFAPPCVGEALSLPKLMQLNVSMNIERLRRSGRLRAAPTGAVKTGGWRVGKLPTPTMAVQKHRLLPSNEVHSIREEPRGLCRFGSPKGIDKRKTDML